MPYFKCIHCYIICITPCVLPCNLKSYFVYHEMTLVVSGHIMYVWYSTYGSMKGISLLIFIDYIYSSSEPRPFQNFLAPLSFIEIQHAEKPLLWTPLGPHDMSWLIKRSVPISGSGLIMHTFQEAGPGGSLLIGETFLF